MKKIVVLFTVLMALVLSAVNPWPAQLRVWNYTGDNVYFLLSYRGEQMYFLTATEAGNTDTRYYSLWEVTRKKYTAEVTACSVTATGTMNLNTNLKLTFTDCDLMRQVKGQFGYGFAQDNSGNWYTFFRPGAFWGEPGMEKPNFYQHWTTYKQLWEYFDYSSGFWIVARTVPRKLNWDNWYFQYDLPTDYEKSVTFVVIKEECWLGGFDICLGEDYLPTPGFVKTPY